VMGPEGAVNIIYRKDISQSPTPDERRQKLMDDYKARFANPYSAAERGYIVLRFTKRQIAYDPDTVADRVRAGCSRAFASAPARAW